MTLAVNLTAEQLAELVQDAVERALDRREGKRAAKPRHLELVPAEPPTDVDRANARRIARRMGLTVRERR